MSGRVTKMYELSVFNSISVLTGVDGHLPLKIGNLTELNVIDIVHSDLSAGPVPESIGLCTGLKYLRLRNCELQGQFPAGLRELKSLCKSHH
jgi:Leucine-rich repeat (LRR) protein